MFKFFFTKSNKNLTIIVTFVYFSLISDEKSFHNFCSKLCNSSHSLVTAKPTKLAGFMHQATHVDGWVSLLKKNSITILKIFHEQISQSYLTYSIY